MQTQAAVPSARIQYRGAKFTERTDITRGEVPAHASQPLAHRTPAFTLFPHGNYCLAPQVIPPHPSSTVFARQKEGGAYMGEGVAMEIDEPRKIKTISDPSEGSNR